MKPKVNENIKILRNRMGITQEKFAELIGINRKAIGSYEEGRATPPLDKLNKIARLFGVTLDELTYRNFETENTIPLFSPEEPESVEAIHPEDLSIVVDSIVVEKKKPFSRTGGIQSKTFEPVREVTSGIPYVSHRFFDKYFLDTDFENRLSDLPFLNLPFYKGNAMMRAFDLPSDSYLKDGIIITERVIDASRLVDEEQYYLIVSLQKGFILKRVVITSSGDYKTKPDTAGETALFLQVSEIREVWKAVGFFSAELPKPQPDLAALTIKINALKSGLDNLL